MEDGFSDSNGVLLNNFNIKDSKELAKTEANISWVNLSRLNDRGGIPGGKFDADHFKEIHKALFSDIYPWAGETRADRCFQGHKETYATGNKEVMVFAPFPDININLKALSNQLEHENFLKGLPFDKFIDRAAYYLDQYNYTHTFREGNGRTMQAAFTQLGYEAGYSLDFYSLNKMDDYNRARDIGMVRQHGGNDSNKNLEALKEMLRTITRPMKTKEAEEIRNIPPAPTPKPSEHLLKMEAKREFDVTGIRVLEMLPAFRGLEPIGKFQERLVQVRFNEFSLKGNQDSFDKVIKAVVTHPAIKPGTADYNDAKRFEQAISQIQKIAKGEKLGEEIKPKPKGPKLR
ncbi:Fic/DOC family protein [Adhaeribacter aquaticus]|uniref:Fic/DOC family protein n=1 Tax=Adhaeribacter aquaticus TaxID=299567 RepID=UPI0004251A9E|nr:Fic family protein [Adhaeribacter aquaticus]